ncbi:putative preprotein translocase secA subunit, partial [Chlamydia psittaci C6/98]
MLQTIVARSCSNVFLEASHLNKSK